MFWKNVQALMRGKDMSQSELASLTGISVQTLSGWISKGRIPRADEAYAIATKLGTTVEFLVTGKAGRTNSDIILRFLEQQIADRKSFLESLK